MENSLEKVSQILAEALLPFAEVFDLDDDHILSFVEELGYDLPDVPPSLNQLQGAGQNLTGVLIDLQEQQTALEMDEGSESELALIFGRVVLSLIDFTTQISDLRSSLAAELPPDFVATTNIAADFETRLYDYLLWQALDRRAPVLRLVLSLLGILESTEFEEDLALHRPMFELKTVHWERISQLIDDPARVFADVYGWGTPDLDVERLFELLTDLSFHFLNAAEIDYPADAFIQAIADGATVDSVEGPDPQLLLPLVNLNVLAISLILYTPPKLDPAEAQSLAATVMATGTLEQEFPLSERLLLELEATMSLTLGLALVFIPGRAVRMINDVLDGGSPGPVATGHMLLSLVYGDHATGEGTRFLTIPGGSYVEYDKVHAKAGVGQIAGGEFDALLEIGLTGGVFSLNASEADGFLASLLPGDGIRTEFDIAAGWTRAHGLYFKGSGSLEIQIPTHLELGPVTIDSLYLIAGFSGSELPIEVSTAISANLGVIQGSVDRLGLQTILDLSGADGNLGPVDLAFKFKPPNGVGLAINAGVVKGGGYLYFDFEREEYAGALELDISGIVTVKAIGLITTRLPDGSKGFSLLIIITAEFGSGIQLGFGFTLLGVGGLLGLNRTMRLDPLLEGVVTGSVNTVLFPKNVVENAPRIISDLRTFFPPQQDRFLIGPMAKLGWGTPALVNLSLGVIIEIPGNIAILGLLQVVLPDEDASLLVLQVAFLGAIEFDKERAWFFATLYQSRVLYMTLEGAMGVLVAWGAAANFVISVGGFHPQFNPPALPFPRIDRITINILNQAAARIQVFGYFAVTTNTVQFGARAELFFGFDAFRVEGHVGFDALMQFSPFYFIVEISASVSLKVFGAGLFSIRLRFSLEGPTPWRARGTGSIRLLFFKFSADFDVTWGEKRDTTLPPVEVMPLLAAELDQIANWTAEIPAHNNLLVSLRSLEPAEADLVLHPVGELRISQRRVPLELTIDKVGNQKPQDANRFTLEVTSNRLQKSGVASESFAMGQFKEMDDATKLSRPAYEPQPGGLLLSTDEGAFNASKLVKRNVRFETVIVDTNYKRFVQRFFTFWAALFTHFLRGSAVTKSELSQHHRRQLQPFAEKIEMGTDTFTVAYNMDNRPFDGADVPPTFSSEAMARDYMQQQVNADPGLAGALHVIPEYEVNQTT